jgi:hypothetical protein
VPERASRSARNRSTTACESSLASLRIGGGGTVIGIPGATWLATNSTVFA